MSWRTTTVTLAALLTFRALPAVAQEALTWADCVSLAAKNNPDIQSSMSTLQSDAYKAKRAYSGFLPQVSGEVDYSSGDLTAEQSGLFDTYSYSASVTANQNVFAGFRDRATVRQTAANREASSWGLSNTKAQISYDLKSAFASLLYAQDYSKLADDIIKRRQENAALVKLRFEAGMENRGSSLLSDAFLGQARYEKHQALHSIDVYRQQLARVLGIDDSEKIRITGKIPIAEPRDTPDFRDIATEIPEYRKAVAQEKAARAGVTLAESNFSPKLDVFATAARLPGSNSGTFGINFNVPIFNGANNYFTLKSSQSDHTTAALNRQSIEEKSLPRLKQTFTDFVDAFEKLKVDRAFLEAAMVRADIARGKYNNGLQSFEDWDIIENDLINKQKAVLQSERALYLAEAAWAQAQGKELFP